MKKVIAFVILQIVCIYSWAQAPGYNWTKVHGSSGLDEGRAVVVGSDGSIYYAGIFAGTIDADPGAGVVNLTSNGSNDMFIVKFDAAGNLQWARSIGGTLEESASDINLDNSGNIIVTGTFESTVDFDPSGATSNLTGLGNVDAFVLKLDSDGIFIWAKAITGAGGPESAYHVVIDAADNIHVTGYFSSTVDFDPNAGTNFITSNGASDIYILKLSSSGNYIWVKSFGAGASDQPSESFLDASGNIYNVGFFQGIVDFDPSGATFDITAAGGFDSYILKLDINGSFVWAKALQGSSNEVIYSLDATSNGDIVVAGYFTGTVDFDPGIGTTYKSSVGNNDAFFGIINTSGDLVWMRTLGDAGNESANAVAVRNDQIYLAGNFEGSVDFDPDASTNQLISNGNSDCSIAKYDINGNYIWAYSFGGTEWELIYEMFIDDDVNIFLAGYFRTAVDFDITAGADTYASQGNNDAFLLSLAGCSSTSSTINPIVCNSFTSPSGNNIYTSSGTYTDTIQNAAGCDSIITINLIIPANCNSCEIANYPFSGNANDASGYLNHGTVNGATLTTDRFGNANSAYQFDGVDDYIDLGTSNLFELTDAFTISVWVKPDSFVGDMKVIEQADNSNFWANYQIYINSVGQVGIGLRESFSTTKYTLTSTSINLSEWNHIVARWSNTTFGGVCIIYINGVEAAYLNQESLGTNVWIEPVESTKIGADIHGSFAAFDGSIDDFKFFNCALSPSQIDSIYQAEAPSQPCGLTANATLISPTCFGGQDGNIDLSVTGGASPYNYQWSNSDNSEDISNLFAGNYTVIVTDAMGCDTMITYTINNGLALDISVIVTNASCGQNNGSATVNIANGTSPFNYQWSSGDTLNTADSLTAGIYMVTVTDANGCSEAETFGVNNTGGMTLSANVTDASCPGVFDGDIDLSVSGGTAPFTYSWSNAAITEDLTNVKAGAYMVQVTDNAGCVAVLTVNIGSSSIDLSSVVIGDPSCGNADGSIALSPTGGTAPYSYQWSSNAGSATTSSVTNLPAGSYFVQVSDNNGCSETEMFSISNPNAPQLEISSVSPAACNGGGGAVNMSVMGGVPPFIYEWSSGETTQDLSGIAQGLYSVDVTDGNGCVSSLNVLVPGTVLPPITLCMSTVNETNGKVLCLWQKPAVDYISHFNIYRENSIAGQYDFWFTRPFDSTSQWTDQTANPQIRGWRYKVTYVDTCGNESPVGINHKTIHVTANLGVGNVVNLIWDNYEGFAYPTFYIERYHPSTGWETIDSIPSSLNSYTDNFPPNGNLQYAISIKAPSTCDPTRIGVNTSRSNVKNQPISANNGISEENITEVTIYPNPAQNEIFVSLGNYKGEKYVLKMFNAIGEIVYQQTVSSSLQKIDTKELASGMYTLQISSEKENWLKKVVINK
jgi:hypothetical protein